MNLQPSTTCPFDAGRDDRKTARIAAERITPDSRAQVVGRFAVAREIFRSNTMQQALDTGDDWIRSQEPSRLPVIFLDGEIHRQKRAAIAKFFTPKALTTRYRALIEQTTDALLAKMQTRGGGNLDDISFLLAVIVTAEILGLSTRNPAGIAKRIEASLKDSGVKKLNWPKRWIVSLLIRYRALRFFLLDVRPAIAARRKQRMDDVISHLLDEGYSDPAILIECLTYGAAGMVTTRELIVVAAWHMLENDALRERFLTGGEDDQFAIIEEILRLEPVAGILVRRATEATQLVEAGAVAAGTLFAIDVRAANTDESVTGSCPHMLDPDRARRMKANGAFMSFGDGSHRCPGAQLALHEAQMFLDRLLRVPGLKLTRPPDVHWCDDLGSYELRNAVLTCDRA